MNEMQKNELRRYANHISIGFDVNCCVFDLPLQQFADENCLPFCRACNRCVYNNTHLYGCYEAERWNQKQIYCCPTGLIFLANTLREHGETIAALITGPILMGEPENTETLLPSDLPPELAKIPNFSTAKVHALSELIDGIVLMLTLSDEEQQGDSDRLSLQFNNSLYELSELPTQSRQHYPIEEEKKLLSAIRTGDKETAQELLNLLLGHIYFGSDGEFDRIKARVHELLILLSRASIDGGGDIDRIFWTNHSVIHELQTIDNLNDLNRWLSAVMHRYISYVFDFTDVKHADIIHKATDYIKQNYASKLTLDEVANHVYLSKSYLSKIFKEELHCNFSAYVNHVRIEKSKLLLADQSINLIDLAMLVGFEDQSYFTKVFKKTVGVSPGKYRESRGSINYKRSN